MPHHTAKRKSHRSTKAFSKRPTLKEHGFRIVHHNLPLKGNRRSMKNIHRSISHLLPRSLNKRANQMNLVRNTRASLHRSAKVAYQQRKEEEKMLEQLKKEEKKEEEKLKQVRKNIREQVKEQKAAHAAAVSNLDDMLSKMHF